MKEMIMTLQELEEKRNVEFENIDLDTLIELKTIKINPSKPVEEKINEFINQIKNPYIFKVGEVAVKVNFAENGPSFQEKFKNFLKDCVKN